MADSATELYRETILEHARNPRNARPVAAPHLSARAANPLCGDELELTLALEAGRIREIGVQVRGCAIAQASASLMSEAIKHRGLAEATAWGARFRALMSGAEMPADAPGGPALAAPPGLPAELEPLRPLQAVRQHRSRIPCVLLAWNALESAAAAGTPAGVTPPGTTRTD